MISFFTVAPPLPARLPRLWSGVSRYIDDRWDIHRLHVDRFVAEAATRLDRAGALILDPAAGFGRYRSNFTRATYLCADLAIGDRHWDYSHLNLVSEIYQLPVKSGSVPVVLLTQTLEHLARPAEALAEVARVLAPGGQLYLSAPFLGDAEHQVPHDYYRYTRYALVHLLESAGFEVLEFRRFGGPATLLVHTFARGLLQFLRTPSYKLTQLLNFVFRTMMVPMAALLHAYDRPELDKVDACLGFGVIAMKK
jgi:SAM-dependent methyltransferase